MDAHESLIKQFEKMGARVKVTALPRAARSQQVFRGWATHPQMGAPIRIDVKRDGRGEYFDLLKREDVDVRVVDVQPGDRHLLLWVRSPVRAESAPAQDSQTDAAGKSRYLCGHDERAWFVAAIPEVSGIRSVHSAKEALKPALVREALDRKRVPNKHRNRRRTDAFVRQGEWFFVPRPALAVKPSLVLYKEPIRRGSGKPHLCEFLYREGGQQVYVNSRYPNGLSHSEYAKLPQPERKSGWRVMVRDARVYVKGKVRHPDHKTILLDCWHLVQMNTETMAAAMRHVAFLD